MTNAIGYAFLLGLGLGLFLLVPALLKRRRPIKPGTGWTNPKADKTWSAFRGMPHGPRGVLIVRPALGLGLITLTFAVATAQLHSADYVVGPIGILGVALCILGLCFTAPLRIPNWLMPIWLRPR